MKCSACGIDHSEGIRYCTQCGDPLVGRCPDCGADVDAEARFCGQCGTALDRGPTPAESTAEAERRQLTVLFCDLVGSTVLSERLDPEDLREVVREYQAACVEVVERFGGHVAQILGDGLLAYFGYPEAHEDDARRAVHAGLGIVVAMGQLNRRLERDRSLRLAVRLGIHTGQVVAGEVGAGERREQLAMGQPPNVAARLQGLAEPDQVLLSHATHQLVHRFFACQELGERSLKGVSRPMKVYRAVRESGVRTQQFRLVAAEKRGPTPLVGRDVELDLLREKLDRVREECGQVVHVIGEAGIGKSRLLRAFREKLVAQDGDEQPWLFCHGSPHHQSSAFHPLIELLEELFRFHRDDSSEQKLSKLEEGLRPFRSPLAETVPLLGALLSLDVTHEAVALPPRAPQGDGRPPRPSPELQKYKTLELVLTLLLELGDKQPVVFVMEDLHWVDPTSLEFLELLVRQGPAAGLFTLLTSRPAFDPPWGTRSHVVQLTLGRLADVHVEAMVHAVAGAELLPGEVLGKIVERTDGIPLFVEELTKVVLASDLTKGLASAAIPATVRDSLMARLDRLGTAKEVAQLASVMGRDFTYEMLTAVSQLPEVHLQEELTRLVKAELVYQRGVPPSATYAFKHTLIRDTAYRSLLKVARRRCHGMVARALEHSFPETIETQPELLAHHYTEAGLIEMAVVHWRKAGNRDLRRGAYREASAHYKSGLVLIEETPESPKRDLTELKMWLGLTTAVGAAVGWAAPEVGEALGQAQRLASGMESRKEIFLLENLLWAAEMFRPDLQKALEHGHRLAQLAQSDHEIHLAESNLGITRYFLGELKEARAHLETALAHESGNPACTVSSIVLLKLGYLDQALARDQQAMACGRGDSGYLYSEVLFLSAFADLVRGEPRAAGERIRELLTLYRKKDSFAQRWGEFWQQVVAVFDAGPNGPGALPSPVGADPESKVKCLWQAYDRTFLSGSKLARTVALADLMTVCLKLGRVEDGRRALKKALAVVAETGERVVEGPLHRLRAELVLAASPEAEVDLTSRQREAESAFRQALQIARRQSAKLFELRAAVSLSRLWRSQGKRDEARELLSEVYGWFTEGLDTAPLKEARELLEELS